MDMICRFWRAQQSEVFIDFWYVDCCEMFPLLKMFLCWFPSNGERSLKSKNWDSTSFIIFVVRSKPSKFTNNIDIFTPFFPWSIPTCTSHLNNRKRPSNSTLIEEVLLCFLINYKPKNYLSRPIIFFRFQFNMILMSVHNSKLSIWNSRIPHTRDIYSHRAPFLCPFVLLFFIITILNFISIRVRICRLMLMLIFRLFCVVCSFSIHPFCLSFFIVCGLSNWDYFSHNLRMLFFLFRVAISTSTHFCLRSKNEWWQRLEKLKSTSTAIECHWLEQRTVDKAAAAFK